MGLLRLLLALSVVIDHTTALFGYTLLRSRMAVQSFFIFLNCMEAYTSFRRGP